MNSLRYEAFTGVQMTDMCTSNKSYPSTPVIPAQEDILTASCW